ncbi:hypothetical protein HYE55_08370 [Aggregatibacter actinomycetemcomitans]|uniref:hypothetical protein n=2 Tax=Aggregatibacter actinomycetemcomitans TaxID=714 RepID=UPI00197C611B|nr:hypothetical protein [Aggregatibacter actinomycetemcomitans]MBN6082067.1 hypothetical protein [Aggregatibacter actinomycetemcomitans]
MVKNYKRTVLYVFVTLAVASNCYSVENINQIEEPDYSETQWRTFYGEKPVDYRPEYWVTYYGSGDNEDCYKPNVVSVVDGKSRIRKEIYKEFIAEEKDGGKNYVIRYPNRFKLGNCMYSSGGGQLYIEEKSDNPRLNQGDYTNKTQIYRKTISRGFRVFVISLTNNELIERNKKSKNYLNKLHYNIFCYKTDLEHNFESPQTLKFLKCFSSSIENGIKKTLMHNSYSSYTRYFWKENPNIKVNFRISTKVYCEENGEYCQKANLLPFDKNRLNPENFIELYQKGDE